MAGIGAAMKELLQFAVRAVRSSFAEDRLTEDVPSVPRFIRKDAGYGRHLILADGRTRNSNNKGGF